MFSSPFRRAHLARSGFVLLACLAVVTAVLGSSSQPARASGFGDLSCLPSNVYPDYSIAVMGPNGPGQAQPINQPVQLTLNGSGGPMGVGRASCDGGLLQYDLDVEWDVLAPRQPQNPIVVSADSVGSRTYQATIDIHETGTGIFGGMSATVIHQSVTTTVDYFGVGPTGTTVSAPSVATVNEPLQISATTQNANPVTGWSWDFGDGTPAISGSDATVPHTYTAIGSYDVTATVTDSLGLTDTATARVDVYAPLVASFTATPGSVGLTATVHVDSAGSATDPAATITGYAWDFGDGLHGTGAAPTHAYATTGTYTITETVTDSLGRTATATHDVTVTDVPGGVSTPPVDAPPVATFTTTTANPTTATPVGFDGTGSTGSSGVTRYAWTFGDGGSSATAQPSHTYQAPGSFPVTLTVTDAAGRTASVTHVVAVHWPATDLAVSVGGSAPKSGQYTYRVTVKNLGHAGAHSIVLTNALDPTQMLASKVTAPAGVTCGGVALGATGTITCKAPSAVLAAGKSWVVAFTVKQPARTQARQVTETSVVRAANPDGVTKNNTARLTSAV